MCCSNQKVFKINSLKLRAFFIFILAIIINKNFIIIKTSFLALLIKNILY